MPRPRTPTLDRLTQEALRAEPALERLRVLIERRHGSLREYARRRGIHSGFLSSFLSGERPLPEIRQMLADDLGVPRLEIDRAWEERRELLRQELVG